MREILFRGKDSKGLWHTGLLAYIDNTCYISNEAGIATAFKVIPETIGQYTGLMDENGIKIFEGDILKCESSYDVEYMVVIFEHGEFHLVDCKKYKNYTECCGYKYFGRLNTKVINNIYDNPEAIL